MIDAINKKIVIFILLLGLLGCNNLFDYSPFDADISSSDLNNINIKEIIAKNQTDFDTVKFAVISDPHNGYNDLKDAITNINRISGLSFVVCDGDLTNWGDDKEFKWYWDEVKKSIYPIISVIGNHDYLGSGKLIYTRMFGPSNFTFQVGSNNFVVFDDVVWENNNKAPDFAWLGQQFVTDKQNIVFTHIPEWSDQMITGKYNQPFDNLLTKNKVLVTIYGHDHDEEDTIINGNPQYVVADIDDRRIVLVSLFNSKFTLKRISY